MGWAWPMAARKNRHGLLRSSSRTFARAAVISFTFSGFSVARLVVSPGSWTRSNQLCRWPLFAPLVSMSFQGPVRVRWSPLSRVALMTICSRTERTRHRLGFFLEVLPHYPTANRIWEEAAVEAFRCERGVSDGARRLELLGRLLFLKSRGPSEEVRLGG